MVLLKRKLMKTKPLIDVKCILKNINLQIVNKALFKNIYCFKSMLKNENW